MPGFFLVHDKNAVIMFLNKKLIKENDCFYKDQSLIHSFVFITIVADFRMFA